MVSKCPVDVRDHPAYVTNHPVDVRDRPAHVSKRPVKVSYHPVNVSNRPVDVTDHPVLLHYRPILVNGTCSGLSYLNLPDNEYLTFLWVTFLCQPRLTVGEYFEVKKLKIGLDMEQPKTKQSRQNRKHFIHYGNKSGIDRQIGLGPRS